MIVTSKKPIAEILSSLAGRSSVALIGCGSCATVARTGGVEQVEEMAAILREHGMSVAHATVLETACHRRLAEREYRANLEAFADADVVLVLACGSGVQNIAEVVGRPTVPGLNTEFIGRTEKAGLFTEWCSACGECVLAETGGICPRTRCAKGLLNGPCGGMFDGRCEVHPDESCAWVLIYERTRGSNGIMTRIVPPRAHAENARPRRRSSGTGE